MNTQTAGTHSFYNIIIIVVEIYRVNSLQDYHDWNDSCAHVAALSESYSVISLQGYHDWNVSCAHVAALSESYSVISLQGYHDWNVSCAHVSALSESYSHQPTRLSRLERLLCTCSCIVGKNQVQFRMAIGNVELMQERFPKHSSTATARMK